MNKYAELAISNIKQAAKTGDERILMAAQTYATLGLSYEQARVADAAETANLIAVLSDSGPDLHAKTKSFHDVYQPMVDALKERLGLA